MQSSSPADMQDQPVSRLLNLPRELRDHVYYFLLLDTRTDPPETPDHAFEQVLLTTSIWINANARRPALFQLRRCNRLLHAEVNDFVKHQDRTDVKRAMIDIMVRGNNIWPTFTHLPLARKPQSTIHVRLRIFPNVLGFGFERGLPSAASRALRHFLALLSQHGPNARLRPWFALPVPLKKLVVDVRPIGYEGHAGEMLMTYAETFRALSDLLKTAHKDANPNLRLPDLRVIEVHYDGDKQLIWHNYTAHRTLEAIGPDPATQAWSFRDQIPDHSCVVS